MVRDEREPVASAGLTDRRRGWLKACVDNACSTGESPRALGWIAPSATSSGMSTIRTSGLNGNGATDASTVESAGEAATSSSTLRSAAARFAQSSPFVRNAPMFIAIAPINSRRPAHKAGDREPRQLIDGNPERGDQQRRTTYT